MKKVSQAIWITEVYPKWKPPPQHTPRYLQLIQAQHPRLQARLAVFKHSCI